MSTYSFRQDDYLVAVDRSQQVLKVEVKDGDDIYSRSVQREMERREQEAMATGGPDGDWDIVGIGFDESFEEEPFAKLVDGTEKGWTTETVPLMAFAQKAKLFNDWLYATLDTMAFQGDTPVLGKQAWVNHLRSALMEMDKTGGACGLLCAAEQLGRGEAIADLPIKLRLQVKKILKKFNADPTRSRPIGFYSESDPLRRLFQHDRLLQERLSPVDVQILAAAIDQTHLADAYGWHLQCSEQTGPLSMRPVLEAFQTAGQEHYALFPPSKAPETDLVKRLYGDRPIPDGFRLIDEVVSRVKDGRLDLTPTEQDGWYLRQLYALDALLHPENERLTIGPKYTQCLAELFKGLMALSRETNIKQLEGMKAGGCPQFIIYPRVRVEPIPAYYQRMAQSYAWLSDRLVALWGEPMLTREVRDRHNCPTSVLDALTDIQALFTGTALLCWEDLGAPQAPLDMAQRLSMSHARKFVANWTNDPDMQADVRMMVPLYYDQERQRTRVSVVCGFLSKDVDATFERRPQVRITDASGQPTDADISWCSSAYATLYPAQFECDVKEVCDRDTLCQLADQHPIPSDLKKALTC